MGILARAFGGVVWGPGVGAANGWAAVAKGVLRAMRRSPRSESRQSRRCRCGHLWGAVDVTGGTLRLGRVVTCIPPVGEGAGLAPSVGKVPNLRVGRLRGLGRTGRGSVHLRDGHGIPIRVVHRLTYRY